MAKSKWDELLENSGAGSVSRNDVVQQLARAASSGISNQSGSSDSSVISGAKQGSNQDASDQISSLVTQMISLASVQQSQVGAVQDNTQALAQNTTSKASGGGTAGSTAGSIASDVLGGGSILSPIIGGLADLFGGGSQPTIATTPFQLPAPVQYEEGIGGGSPGQATPVSYGETGQPRALAAPSAPQVNIQISAMDSQSFLDHSDQIATAVKQALLNSHSLGDVISDL